MKDTEQRIAAKKFVEFWTGKGYEKGESQPFWLELLENVFGVENPAHYIRFEDRCILTTPVLLTDIFRQPMF